MVHVSKKYIERPLQKEAWDLFFNMLDKDSSLDVIIKKLGLFFTTGEITMLEKRLATSILLKKGASYREIGRIIDVTPQTISFVKNHLVRKPVTHRVYSIGRPSKRRHRKLIPSIYRGTQRMV